MGAAGWAPRLSRSEVTCCTWLGGEHFSAHGLSLASARCSEGLLLPSLCFHSLSWEEGPFFPRGGLPGSGARGMESGLTAHLPGEGGGPHLGFLSLTRLPSRCSWTPQCLPGGFQVLGRSCGPTHRSPCLRCLGRAQRPFRCHLCALPRLFQSPGFPLLTSTQTRNTAGPRGGGQGHPEMPLSSS